MLVFQECLVGEFDCLVDFLLGLVREFNDEFLGGWVDYFEGLGGGGVDPLPVDEGFCAE